MKNHKNTRRWYKPKDRKAIRQKRREHKQKVKQCINCKDKCYEYFVYCTSDKGYQEWSTKRKQCKLENENGDTENDI